MQDKEARVPAWVKYVAFTVILFWIMCGGISKSFSGDFQAMDALFSGLAFIGLIATLIYQRHELALQKKVQRESQQALSETATANTKTAELAEKNLRAQFLSFWLEMNKDRYLAIMEIQRTIADSTKPMELLNKMMEVASWISGKKLSPRAPKPPRQSRSGVPACVDMNTPSFGGEDSRIPVYEELRKFLDEYEDWIKKYEGSLEEFEKLTELSGK